MNRYREAKSKTKITINRILSCMDWPSDWHSLSVEDKRIQTKESTLINVPQFEKHKAFWKLD